jgi:tripartite-type tricarboxylate transporter receptor subunit TctC
MNVIVVSNDTNIKTLADLIAVGKKGAPLSVGTFSTAHRLAAARMGSLTGLTFNDVPYKGQSQVQTDVIGNNLDFAFLDLGGAFALIRSNKMRALAVTGETRHPDFPDIPAVNETKGLESYSQYAWNAFFIRKEVPEAIHAKLSDAVRRVMTSQEAIEGFYKPKGTEAMAVPAEAVKAMQVRSIQEYRKVFEALGLNRE